MNQGVLRVTLTNVSLSQAKTLTGETTVVEISVGNQRFCLEGEGKSFTCREIGFFDIHKEVLDVYAYTQNQRNHSRLVYGQVNLVPLISMPKTRHVVNVQTVYFENGMVIDEASGTIDLEIVYTEDLDSVFEITVDSAVLIRDTEVVGKMDPYTELSLEGETKKTTVKQNAGKEPRWEEKFLFILKRPDSKLHCVVKDQDVTTSDLVGKAEIGLRELGLLNPQGQEVTFTVDLMYKEKKAGEITLKTKFIINHYKK